MKAAVFQTILFSQYNICSTEYICNTFQKITLSAINLLSLLFDIISSRLSLSTYTPSKQNIKTEKNNIKAWV